MATRQLMGDYHIQIERQATNRQARSNHTQRGNHAPACEFISRDIVTGSGGQSSSHVTMFAEGKSQTQERFTRPLTMRVAITRQDRQLR